MDLSSTLLSWTGQSRAVESLTFPGLTLICSTLSWQSRSRTSAKTQLTSRTVTTFQTKALHPSTTQTWIWVWVSPRNKEPWILLQAFISKMLWQKWREKITLEMKLADSWWQEKWKLVISWKQTARRFMTNSDNLMLRLTLLITYQKSLFKNFRWRSMLTRRSLVSWLRSFCTKSSGKRSAMRSSSLSSMSLPNPVATPKRQCTLWALSCSRQLRKE